MEFLVYRETLSQTGGKQTDIQTGFEMSIQRREMAQVKRTDESKGKMYSNEQNRNTISVSIAVNYSLLHFKLYVILNIYVCILNLATTKFESAKKPRKRQKPGDSAEGDRVAGSNPERNQCKGQKGQKGSGSQSGGLKKN
jgi:hypothetical protein